MAPPTIGVDVGGTKIAGGYRLSLRLPFAAKSDLDLLRKGEDLYIKVGPYKRTLMLPSVLRRLEHEDAAFEGDRLNITFKRAGEEVKGGT